MTLEQATEFVQTLLTFAALVSVIWSAIVFVRNIGRQRDEARARELRQWQKASVHEMLHRSERFLSVEQITNQLRSASFDTPMPVGKHELTAAEVRLLLLEMLQGGLVQQLWNDQYGITRRDPQTELAYMEIERQDLVRSAYDIIQLAPGRLTTDDLIVRLNDGSKVTAQDRARFLLMMHDLLSKGIARMSESGEWFCCYPSDRKMLSREEAS